VLGRGLWRGSMDALVFVTSVVVEEFGVAWAELAGEWLAELPREGEALPPAEDSPFFFEDLLDSLPVARESCSC
jgi:hypothetical protein